VTRCAASVAVVTLKNRTLSPAVERFLAWVHEVAKSVEGQNLAVEYRFANDDPGSMQ